MLDLSCVKDVVEDFKSTYGKSVVYACLGGSHAYGLASEESDVDVKIVYWETKEEVFGFKEAKNYSYDVIMNGVKYEVTAYPLRHFLNILLNSNCTILEMLFVEKEHVIMEDERFMRYVRENLDSFLSGEAYYSFQCVCNQCLNRVATYKAIFERYRAMDDDINWLLKSTNLKKDTNRLRKEVSNFYRLYNNYLSFMSTFRFGTKCEENRDELLKLNYDSSETFDDTKLEMKPNLIENMEANLKRMDELYERCERKTSLNKDLLREFLMETYFSYWGVTK